MSEDPGTAPAAEEPHGDATFPPSPPPAESPTPAYEAAPAYVHPGPITYAGPAGKVRSTGTCFLLTIVTLGFYTWYWYFATHDEMKRHTGEGLGGPVALVLAIFVGVVMPFLTPNEVGNIYERSGRPRPVSAATGLWALLLGWFFFVGLIVWFVKTNGALNDYWRSLSDSSAV